MSKKRMGQIEQRIARIKEALGQIGPMRPGSLTRQYRNPKQRVGAYWQISYTRQMKSHTEYVRSEWEPDIRKQIANYKQFTCLVEQWINLGIEHSKLRMQIAKQERSK
jgi:hypothetical protein